MAPMSIPRSTFVGGLSRWAAGLRFPWLLALSAAVFVLDLAIPDLIPFADEILLGLATVILGSIRRRRAPDVSSDDGRDEAG
jgi:hypothetical protein